MLHAVTPYGREGPSSRVRVYEWLDRISEPRVVSGYISLGNAKPAEVACHPLAVVGAERRLRRIAAQRPEQLLLHREASPLSRGKLERRLLANAGFSAYDFDDALQWDFGEGGLLRRLAPKAPKALAAVRAADRVVAGNAVLGDWAAEHNRDVVIVPSCVAPQRYRPKTKYSIPEPARLGWIGSISSEAYFPPVAEALLEVHRRTGARLTLIGTVRPWLGALEAIIDRVPWSESAQYRDLADFDLGISPVTDSLYERGKSGYKLLQYAAAGVPIVASPVGVNREMLQTFGYPAPDRADDWVDAIVEMLTRPASEREAMAARARVVTEREYSFDAWIGRWRAAVGLGQSEGES